MKTTALSNKEIAEEYTNTVWNTKDLSIIDQLIHKDVIIHSLLGDFHGINAVKEIVHTWLKGFPNLRVNTNLLFGENDLVCTQWDVQATHQGEFKGKKASGKKVSYSGTTIYRIKQGKIVEYWAYIDMQNLLSQIS